MQAGIRAHGLAWIKEVKRLRKNDKRKQAFVWLVKSRTVVGHEWILDRLEMGHRSNVTRAMAGFRNGGDRETRGLKAKMSKCATPYHARIDAFSPFVTSYDHLLQVLKC